MLRLQSSWRSFALTVLFGLSSADALAEPGHEDVVNGWRSSRQDAVSDGYGFFDDGYSDDDWYYDYDDSYEYDGYGGKVPYADDETYDGSYFDSDLYEEDELLADDWFGYEQAHYSSFWGYDDAGEEGLFDW